MSFTGQVQNYYGQIQKISDIEQKEKFSCEKVILYVSIGRLVNFYRPKNNFSLHFLTYM